MLSKLLRKLLDSEIVYNIFKFICGGLSVILFLSIALALAIGLFWAIHAVGQSSHPFLWFVAFLFVLGGTIALLFD